MADSDRTRWDKKYAGMTVPSVAGPDDWLVENVSDLLPGRALDLACGLGHNAAWLANRGWSVDAVDISANGLDLAKESTGNSSSICWIAADLESYELTEAAYDLVIVFRYLERSHLPEQIIAALRPQGILVYETFSIEQLKRADNHLKNPAFLLSHGELPEMFSALSVLRHCEVELEDRSVARLLARK